MHGQRWDRSSGNGRDVELSGRPKKSPLPSGLSLIDTPALPGRAGNQFHFMSQHRSLRAAAGTTGAKRNVLKRFERVAVLKSRNQWKDGDRVVGLRKTLPPV